MSCIKKKEETTTALVPTTKSSRGQQDDAAKLGVGATNILDRLAASVGCLQEAQPVFSPALDVPCGGVLLALPALLACGLLLEVQRYFQLPKGYYGLQSIFILLAFMALARIKTVEDFRYCASGEWGKVLGLDRAPEVRTLRTKIKHLSCNGQVKEWGAELCKQWIQTDTEAPAVFYIDGHVRVYYGSQTKLPKHYVAREKLCLRATTDYWVNAMDGQPFFYVNKAVDPGLLQVLENDIIPKLEQEIPRQDDPHKHRFTIVFDREGYSPDFMKRMKDKDIACITYHKHPKDEWPVEEFVDCQVPSQVTGNVINCKLAERGTCLPNRLWVREIRKLGNNGHQTSILSTDFNSDLRIVAVEMGSRWTQENFFKYMRHNYNLDRLIEYSLDPIPDPTKVVNPAYRSLDKQVRNNKAKQRRLFSEFGKIQLHDEIEPAEVEKY